MVKRRPICPSQNIVIKPNLGQPVKRLKYKEKDKQASSPKLWTKRPYIYE
jgi:hypothetical protein